MQVDEHTYREANLTTFASYRTEAAAAAFAIALAEEKRWDVDSTIRAINLAFLSGGRSGQPRDPRTFEVNVLDLRLHCRGVRGTDDLIFSFNKTPLQRRIIDRE